MKRVFIYFILFILSSFNSLAQSINSNRYSDKFALSIDILNAAQNHNIQQLESIAKSLTIPYSIYVKDMLPLYKKNDNNNTFPENEIYPSSLYITDSLLYNKYASNFYFGTLIQSLLNDAASDSNFGTNVYLAFNKENRILSDNIYSNYIGLLFETKKSVKIINLEALTTFNNTLYSMRQAQYNSYSKEELPRYLMKKMPESITVYKLTGNNFTRYNNDTIQFNNVDYSIFGDDVATIESYDEAGLQKNSTEEKDGKDKNITKELIVQKDSTVLDRSEEMPSFQNGTKGLNKFLKENLRYPKEALKKKIEGNIIVRLMIDKDGSVKDPIILKDNLGAGCTEEALRLVQKMPKWWPGKEKGKAVKVYYTLPISFTIPK